MIPSSALAVVLFGGLLLAGLSTRSTERVPLDVRVESTDGRALPSVLLPSPAARAPSANFLRDLQSALAVQEPQQARRFRQLGYGTDLDVEPPYHDFYFTRGMYSGGRGGFGGFRRGGRGSWSTDYPEAEYHLTTVMQRLTNLDLWYGDNLVPLDDPELRRYPFVYILEVGYMRMTAAEVEGLRSYLEAGGFLMVDDFWGSWEWENFRAEIARVFPDREIVELRPGEHPIFNMVYNIEEIVQVPGIGGGRGRPTYQQDGVTPYVRGIFDDDGRLMVVINFNTDLGDAWEHADNPFYPLESSTYAFEVAINQIVYAMSH